MVIKVHTGGEATSTIDFSDATDLLSRSDMPSLEEIKDAAIESEEVRDASMALLAAARLHNEKYPNTQILFTPFRALKTLELVSQ